MQSASAGRSGSRWRKLHANLKAQRRPCWICGMPIDYRLVSPHPGSFTAHHKVPLSKDRRGAEDPANLVAAHRLCNLSLGDREPEPRSIGTLSRHW